MAMCRRRFSKPASRAATFSAPRASNLDPAVVLERADRGDQDHGGRWRHVAYPDDDVEELLRPQVRGEARLRDDPVGQPEGEIGRGDGVRAMGDVGERTAVDERGRAFEGLDEVRPEGVPEERGHGPFGLEVGGEHRPSCRIIADEDAAEPVPEVLEVAGQTEDGHDLAGRGDVEARLPGDPLERAANAGDDVAEDAVVHVDRPPDDDVLRVEKPAGAVEMDVVVGHRGKKVLGRGDGVKVAGEMEVDVVGGHDPGQPAARRPAFHSENRS